MFSFVFCLVSVHRCLWKLLLWMLPWWWFHCQPSHSALYVKNYLGKVATRTIVVGAKILTWARLRKCDKSWPWPTTSINTSVANGELGFERIALSKSNLVVPSFVLSYDTTPLCDDDSQKFPQRGNVSILWGWGSFRLGWRDVIGGFSVADSKINRTQESEKLAPKEEGYGSIRNSASMGVIPPKFVSRVSTTPVVTIHAVAIQVTKIFGISRALREKKIEEVSSSWFQNFPGCFQRPFNP